MGATLQEQNFYWADLKWLKPATSDLSSCLYCEEMHSQICTKITTKTQFTTKSGCHDSASHKNSKPLLCTLNVNFFTMPVVTNVNEGICFTACALQCAQSVHMLILKLKSRNTVGLTFMQNDLYFLPCSTEIYQTLPDSRWQMRSDIHARLPIGPKFCSSPPISVQGINHTIKYYASSVD